MNIESAIREYVIRNLVFGDEHSVVSDDESFLESGIIDSLAVVELVTFVGEHFGIEIPPDDITPDNFDSVRSVSDYVRRRVGVAA